MYSRMIFVTLTALLPAVICMCPNVRAYGDEEHADSAMNDSSEAAIGADSAVIALDSVCATIQAGFKKLGRIFEKGCFNCHTDRTEYPWYHSIPLVKSLIDSDIEEARKRVDMSNGFPFKSRVRPADVLAEIRDEIESGGMPPLMYRMMHWSAKPSDAERDSIFQWIDSSLALLKAHGQTPGGEEE
ncbi:MAG: heme-binding domain-containing protein [Candidatus Zixiibacteriota bacterium]